MGLTNYMRAWGHWGSHVILEPRSSFAGALSCLRRKKKTRALGAAGCGKIHLALWLSYRIFLAAKTKAFILLMLKSPFPSTSINLQNLKRAPVSLSKRGGFRNLTGRRGVFKPLTAKPDIS